jgi:hypothetical protein
MKNLRRRPPVQKISIEERDFSLDKATPHSAAAIEAQVDRDDASDNFIKEKPHPKYPFIDDRFDDQAVFPVNRQGERRAADCMIAVWIECGRIWCWFNCSNNRGAGNGQPKVISYPLWHLL